MLIKLADRCIEFAKEGTSHELSTKERRAGMR